GRPHAAGPHGRRGARAPPCTHRQPRALRRPDRRRRQDHSGGPPMSATTKKNTAPSLLTEDTIREVCEALLHHALRGHQGAVEHEGVVPPVGVEQVTYRRGPLEVEELGWSAGGAKVAQQIDVWVP